MKRILYIIAFVFSLSTAVAQVGETAPTASRIVIGGEYFYVHTVQPGETLFSLSRKYDVSQNDIKKNNPQVVDGLLRSGEAVKIPAPAPEPLPRNIRNRTSSNRKVEVHTVNPGETIYSIARRYEVSIDNLIESNAGLDPTRISIGQRIMIPRGVIGTSTPREIEAEFTQYTEALSEVADGWGYHLVERGQTLYSLTRQLGIPEDTLRKYNPTELAGGLKAGSVLRYPAATEATSPQGSTETIVLPETGITYENQDAKAFSTSETLHVALLMPFTTNGREEETSLNYYNGTLLALQDLKASGVSVRLSVFDTKRSAQEVRRILRSDEMNDVDLIIGPRTDEAFEEASRFAYRQRIPIVSPQWQIDTENPFAYQVRPGSEFQYDKLKPFLTPEHNIVLISPATADVAFKNEVEALLPATTKRISYAKTTSATAIQNLLSREKDNIIIIPSVDENTTDEILAKISTIQNAVSSRTGRGYPVRVVGSPQWARFTNNDKELFFKLQAMYVIQYYADRASQDVVAFDQRYLSAFGMLPSSLFAYRGYDVAKLFVSAIKQYGDRYAQSLNRVDTPLLQVPYHFRQHDNGKWVNDQWVLVQYRNDYIIDVK